MKNEKLMMKEIIFYQNVFQNQITKNLVNKIDKEIDYHIYQYKITHNITFETMDNALHIISEDIIKSISPKTANSKEIISELRKYQEFNTIKDYFTNSVRLKLKWLSRENHWSTGARLLGKY